MVPKVKRGRGKETPTQFVARPISEWKIVATLVRYKTNMYVSILTDQWGWAMGVDVNMTCETRFFATNANCVRINYVLMSD
jgi:hypothetical protein